MAEHQHAEILRAIADGKEIEIFNPVKDLWVTASLGAVVQFPNARFRVKPEPKPDVERWYVLGTHPGFGYPSESEAIQAIGLFSAPAYAVHVVIDGETGKAKSVEIVG